MFAAVSPVRRWSLALIVCVACVATRSVASAPLTQPTPGPALSVEEIRKLHDTGQYRSALQEAARTLRTPAGEKDKYQLQLIRGDCLLHQDDAPTALSASKPCSAPLSASITTAMSICRSCLGC